MSRVRARVEGTVQGVGFRPYVYRLAGELGVAGHVLNDARGVVVEVEAPPGDRGALPRSAAARGAAAGDGRAGHRGAARGARRARLLDPREPGRRRAARRGHARQRHLCRLPGRAVRPRRQALPLSVRQLHELRAAIHDRARRPVRPARTRRWPASRCAPPAGAEYDDPARPPLPRPAQRLSGVRAAGDGWSEACAGGRRSRPRRSRCWRARSWRSRASAATTSPAAPTTTTPSPGCARASTARTSRSR